MASNKDIISKAITNSIEKDTPVGVLLVSNEDTLSGETTQNSSNFGMNYTLLYIGMSGQKFVDQTNSNWTATDAQFATHNKALNIRIISNQLKEIKLENDILYYTTETLEEGSETDNRTWFPVESSWGKIKGSISDQKDLQEALSNKVSTNEFNTLVSVVSTNTSNITSLKGDITTISNNLSDLINTVNGANGIAIRLTKAENKLAKTIISDDVLAIRATEDGFLEYTTNNEDWHSVSTAGTVEWGDIIGDITNQADLQLILKNLTSDISTNTEDIKNHINDTENPHNVTASQVGLGNVDNTSDENKPVSIAQQQAIDNLNIKAMTKADYDSIEEKNDSTIYLITDM
jgi:hypothetical protein